MRQAFWSQIAKLMQAHEEIVILHADTSYKVMDEIKEQFPDRIYNVGIAEQNMIGVACGMAQTGLLPICYAITPFVTMRPFEQVRVQLGVQKQKVILVGVGAGLDYSTLGSTHHGDVDIALMRLIPGMGIYTPSDEATARYIADKIPEIKGPAYIRLSRYSSQAIRGEELLDAEWQQGYRIISGGDINNFYVFSTGVILEEVDAACQKLYETVKLQPTIVDILRMSPPPYLFGLLLEAEKIMCVEEHSMIGGLGTMFAELLSMLKPVENNIQFRRLGIVGFIRKYGNRQCLLETAGLDRESIFKQLLAMADQN